MSEIPITLPKNPVLQPAADYYRLRREGIGFIEQMGSRQWTDYNTHDPGITIHEALCYALTELAYKTGWDIKDILAPATSSTGSSTPFPYQPFFTAREILTVNPVTPDDFRRLLIDLDEVRNAWVFCRDHACDVTYYAWCEQDQLKLSFRKPEDTNLLPKSVEPRGLYDVMLEFETDPVLGDLNDRKLELVFQVFDDDGWPHPMTLEVRFPQMSFEQDDLKSRLDSVTLTSLKLDPTAADTMPKENELDAWFREHWQKLIYVTFKITLQSKSITIRNATLCIFGDNQARRYAKDIATLLTDISPVTCAPKCSQAE